MKKVCIMFSFVFAVISCRKDKTTVIDPDQLPPGGKCLVLTTALQNGLRTENTYQLDSVPAQSITKYNGITVDEKYLILEASGQLLYTRGGKNAKDALSRIFLNADGSVAKEVAVELATDGKTLVELPAQKNVFSYNSKKQLIRVDINIVDECSLNFTYDSKGRIVKIVQADLNGDILWIYENFTYLDQAKTDNSCVLPLIESMSNLLIPSIRNFYISGYRLKSTLSDDFNVNETFSYTIKKGKLTGYTESYTAFGGPVEIKADLTLSCK